MLVNSPEAVDEPVTMQSGETFEPTAYAVTPRRVEQTRATASLAQAESSQVFNSPQGPSAVLSKPDAEEEAREETSVATPATDGGQQQTFKSAANKRRKLLKAFSVDDSRESIGPHVEQPSGSVPNSQESLSIITVTESGLSDSKFDVIACSHCPCKFTQKSEYIMHLRRFHRMMNTFTCDRCSISYNTNVELKIHINIVHVSNSLFECSVVGCDATFNNVVLFNKHQSSHGKRKLGSKSQHNKVVSNKIPPKEIISCQRCNSKRPAITEKTDDTMQSQFHCNLCEAEFTTYGMLQYHITSFHWQTTTENQSSDDELFKSFLCLKCGERYHTVGELLEHTLSFPHGERPLQCTYCDRYFGCVEQLNAHRCHYQVTPSAEHFSCKHCDKAFTSSERRSHHIFYDHEISVHHCDE